MTIAHIIDTIERLSACQDGDDAVLLYIPDRTKFDHHHIVMDREEAQRLHNWLGDYLALTKDQS